MLELLFVKGWANKDVAAFLGMTEQQIGNIRFAAIKKIRMRSRPRVCRRMSFLNYRRESCRGRQGSSEVDALALDGRSIRTNGSFRAQTFGAHFGAGGEGTDGSGSSSLLRISNSGSTGLLGSSNQGDPFGYSFINFSRQALASTCLS